VEYDIVLRSLDRKEERGRGIHSNKLESPEEETALEIFTRNLTVSPIEFQ
jgi:hypothetical protein